MGRLLFVGLLALGLSACRPKDTCDAARLEAGLDRWESRLADQQPSHLERTTTDFQELEDAVLAACPGAPEFFGFLLKFNTTYRRYADQRGPIPDLPVRTDKILSQMQAVTQKHCSVPSLSNHIASVPADQRAIEAQRVCDLPRPIVGPSATLYFALEDRGISEALALRTTQLVFSSSTSLPSADPAFLELLPERSTCHLLPPSLVVRATGDSLHVPTRTPLRVEDKGAFASAREMLREDALGSPEVRHIIVAADAGVPASTVDALRGIAPDGYETLLMVNELSQGHRWMGVVPWPEGDNAGTVAEVVAAGSFECDPGL